MLNIFGFLTQMPTQSISLEKDFFPIVATCKRYFGNLLTKMCILFANHSFGFEHFCLY